MSRFALEVVVKDERVVDSDADDDEDAQEHEEGHLLNLQHHAVHEIRDGEGKDDLKRHDDGEEQGAEVHRHEQADENETASHDEDVVTAASLICSS